MLKLIRKDLMAFGYILAFQMVSVLLLMSFGLFFDRNGNMAFIAMLFYPLLLPTVLLLSDQAYLTLLHSLPVSRKQYVLAKYAGGVLFAGCVLSIGCLYGFIVTRYIQPDGISFQQLFSLKGISFMLLPVILMNSVTFPIYFAFSKEKGSFVLIIVLIAILLGSIIGLVYAEKSLVTEIYYEEADIFPVLMYQLGMFIDRIGSRLFIAMIFCGSIAVGMVSVLASLTIVRHKDIGGAL